MTDSTALPMTCLGDRHVWTWRKLESGIIPTGTPCDCGVKMWRAGGCSRCNEKDKEIQRLRAALEAVVAHEESLGGGLCGWSTTFHIAARALAGKKGEEQL